MCGEELVKELQLFGSPQACYGVGFFANFKGGDLHQVTGKLNQICYHIILRHHAIPSGISKVH